MNLSGRIAQGVLMTGVGLAVGAGLAMNVYFAQTLEKESLFLKGLYILAAVASTAIKMSLIVYLRDALTRGRSGLWTMLVVATLIDVAMGIGFVSVTRGEATLERTQQASDYRRYESDAKREDDKLKGMQKPRASAAKIAKEHAAAKATAGPCSTDRAKKSDPCQAVGRLDIEAQGAKDYETQEAKRDAANSKLADHKPTVADPQGNAIAALLRSLLSLLPFGLTIEDQTAARIVSVLIALLIELAGLYGFDAALRRPTVTEKPARPPRNVGAQAAAASLQTAVQPGPVPGSADCRRQPPAAGQRRPRANDPVVATLEGLRELIEGRKANGISIARDGTLFGSQRDLGGAIGISATEVNKHLKRLARDKLADVTPTPRGTYVKLPAQSLFSHKPRLALATVTRA